MVASGGQATSAGTQAGMSGKDDTGAQRHKEMINALNGGGAETAQKPEEPKAGSGNSAGGTPASTETGANTKAGGDNSAETTTPKRDSE